MNIKDQGFIINEYHHEGARNWPDGELKPYLDEDTKRNMQNRYATGVIKYVAKKSYDSHWAIAESNAFIVITTKDGFVVDVSGSISTSAI